MERTVKVVETAEKAARANTVETIGTIETVERKDGAGKTEEFLDLRRMDGTRTGEKKERSAVHRDGDLHGASHVWLFRKTKAEKSYAKAEIKQARFPENNLGKVDSQEIDLQEIDSQYEILLQKRSRQKDSFPGYYDISSAGHIPSGQDYLQSAQRELLEELGIQVEPEELVYLGIHYGEAREEFYGRPFHNREISAVFACCKDIQPEDMKLQEEEVEEVLWAPLARVREQLLWGDEKLCVFPEELAMLHEYFVFRG